jgi:hypothetical protein
MNFFTFCRYIGRQLNNLNEPIAFEIELPVENLSSLTSYAEEIIGDQQCGFRRTRPAIDFIFFFRQVLEKKWE